MLPFPGLQGVHLCSEGVHLVYSWSPQGTGLLGHRAPAHSTLLSSQKGLAPRDVTNSGARLPGNQRRAPPTLPRPPPLSCPSRFLLSSLSLVPFFSISPFFHLNSSFLSYLSPRPALPSNPFQRTEGNPLLTISSTSKRLGPSPQASGADGLQICLWGN